MNILYKCPLCAQTLEQSGRSLRCNNNHCFDLAREGYVNLHPVQEKNSLQPGDNKEMLAARQCFLNAGYYQALAKELKRIIFSNNAKQRSILDLGCGEGYYLEQLSTHSANNQSQNAFFGLDISKEGVRRSAKRKTGAELSVASVFKLPFFDDVFDIIYSVFAPIDLGEVARTLKPGGQLIAVGPHENHLRELAETIYEKAQSHSESLNNLKGHPSFELSNELRVQESPTIENEHRLDLLKMTPYYWQAQPSTQLNLNHLSNITLDFKILVFSCNKVL